MMIKKDLRLQTILFRFSLLATTLIISRNVPPLIKN